MGDDYVASFRRLGEIESESAERALDEAIRLRMCAAPVVEMKK